jgi:YD repeat-containing protein
MGMSAVFTGNGLGLFNTSLTQVGAGGNAKLGQRGDLQYVNLATGNLVWQANDEHLSFRGLSLGFNRTYNSLGQLADVGADGWSTGFERRVALLEGTFNTAGSVMRRYTGDGGHQDFVYVAPNQYQSTGGDGAHDSLSWTGSGWDYVEGSSRLREQYADHADAVQQGRLLALQNLRSDGVTPAGWQVIYDSNQRIAEIRAVDGGSAGDAIVFGYDGEGRLASIATREGGTVYHQVAYEYDSQGRLSAVTTDLTVGNTADNAWDAGTAANNDGKLFRTEYSYDGNSLRLASVRQSDGTLVSYSYHADGRLQTITRGDSNNNDSDGVGETLSYAYGAGSTTVTDSLGRVWTYAFDAAGQLTSVTSPAVDGQSDVTAYQYDADGNLTQVRTTRGAATLALQDLRYDARGNLTWQWDGAGNAVQNTWSSSNQLLSQTRYTGVDPDRDGDALPTGGLTTHYVYDAQHRLRFIIDAAGQVSEIGYAIGGNGIGQQSSQRSYLGAVYSGDVTLAALEGWATTTQKSQSLLTEFSYDLWGRLSQRNDYAAVDANGAGVFDGAARISRFSYDAQGALRQQLVLHGAGRTADGAAVAGSEQVDYVYDGMGRLLSVVSKQVGGGSDDASTLQSSYSYLDSGHQMVVTNDAGATRAELRDAAGRLISVSDSGTVAGVVQTRTRQNFYDSAGQLRASEDANGGRSYFFYDGKGRLEATVDATGTLSRSFYDGSDRVVGTRMYANRLTTSGWLVSGEVVPTQLSALSLVADDNQDRVTASTYDAAGRLQTVTDGLAGNNNRRITSYSYDGASRLLQTRTTDAAGTAATAQLQRYFYDEAGRVVATLDAEGGFTETVYNLAGQAVQVTRYVTHRAPPALWESGTLAQLRPTADPTKDQVTRYFYDGRGQRTGQLDGEGYLTEWVFDEAGNSRAERRYTTALTWAANDTLATLRSRAGAAREVRMSYNGLGQLITRVNAEGSVERYTYDEAGRLVKSEAAYGTSEIRAGHLRYNVFGELIGELSGESAPLVLPGMTEAQLDAIYAQHGVRHGYDVLGQRIESIDAAGNRTWYFYDAAGRQTFVVRGVADDVGVANARAEVVETRYNAFGQVREQIAYTQALTLAVPGSRASAASAISTLAYAAAVDSRRQFSYDTRGLVASRTDAEGVLTQYSYDAFGQVSRELRAVGTGAESSTDYRYDRRGGLIETIQDLSGALERHGYRSYDYAGRLIAATDARGQVVSYGYDRLDRQVSVASTVSGRNEISRVSYDAHGRVLTETDARGYITTYSYNDSNRSVSITTPEGVNVVTTHNRHGQTVLVTDAAGRSEFTYNLDGNLTLRQRKAADGSVVEQESREYDDARGWLTATIDGSGRRIALAYDAAGRVLQRIEDPTGQARTTRYAFDAQGRQIRVTDASNRVSAYQYDREGRIVEVALDPSGLNSRTSFTYDAEGRQLTRTDGTGTAAVTVAWAYDSLGRRISETVDPGAGKLNLVSAYAYDKNDNLIRRTDANGKITRYFYDANNRLQATVDALGTITRSWYDTDGRLVAQRSMLAPTNAATLTDSSTAADIDARVAMAGNDRLEYRIYDRDGNLRFVNDMAGNTSEYDYDAAGRMIKARRYATAYFPPAGLLSALALGTALDTDINLTSVRNDAKDQVQWQVLDAAGRASLTVDAMGNVRRSFFDDAGRVVGVTAYSRSITLTTALRNQLDAGTATAASLLALVTADAAKDQVEYHVHDAAGRARYSIDAIGAVREVLTDAAGQIIGARNYATAVTADATLRSKLQAGTASVADIQALLTTAIQNDSRNQEQYQIRDAAGRVRFTLSILRDAAGVSTGVLSEVRYDNAGRVTDEIRRETAVDAASVSAQLSALRAGTANLSTVTGWMTGATRTTSYVRDAAGRLRYTLRNDAAGNLAVAERRYDSVGRVVAELAYAVAVPNATARTVAAIASAITAAGGDNASQQRIVRYVYDAVGQLRFSIDDAGAVSEFRYDALGQTVQSRQYAITVNLSANASEADVAAAVAGQTGGNVRITSNAYDAAGRISSVTDAAGKSEYYGYDALGQRTSLTNKLGNVWTYAYDAAGRLVEENTPVVSVSSITLAGDVTQANRSVRTTITYDALGNVLTRTEDATGPTPRITQYAYDSRGNQVQITFPDAWKIDETTQQYVASGVTPTIKVTYNALGQAVVQEDVRGKFTYKVYDSLGRLAVDIDAEGYASAYSYNSYGEQTQLRRYASKTTLTAIAGFTSGTAVQLSQLTGSVLTANASQDRTLDTRYDSLGRKIEIKETALTYYRADGSSATGSPTTQFSYNSYGDLTRTSVLLDQANNVWAHSYQYYDDLGRNTLSVDAQGYVSRTTFDAYGQVTEVKQYARGLSAAQLAALTTQTPPSAPAAGTAELGYDRVVSFTYDAMGRKASEAVKRHYTAANGLPAVRDVVTSWTYDNEGRATATNVDGQISQTGYDALGRITSVKEAAQLRLVNDAESQLASAGVDLGSAALYVMTSAYSTLEYDAFGNAIQVVRYANGVPAGQNPPTQITANDQVSRTFYDRQGRAVMSLDAAGNRVNTQYDAADHVTRVWYTLTTAVGTNTTVNAYYTYDNSGRQLSGRTVRDGASRDDAREYVSYNGFGEIIAKGDNESALQAQFQYDQAGRMVRNNADGAWRDYGYNLAGYQQREAHAVLTATGVQTAVTLYTTDHLGRVTRTSLPGKTDAANDRSISSQGYDRWNNVTEIIDPRGYQINFQYNEADQRVREIRPLVKVVTTDAAGSWQRPELTWAYDALGRMTASTDGNGNTTRYEYDGSGRQVKVIDANGVATLMAYDALGRARLTQNGVGYITFKQFDKLDRITAQGDFLVNGNVRTQKTRETYLLNQNGNRLQVTNGMSQATKYAYDSQGNLLRSETPMAASGTGVVMEYDYDLAGRRILERYALAHVALTDRDGETVNTNEQTWDYDYFGRLTDHNDLSGRDYNYSYDAQSGQRVGETNTVAGTNTQGLNRSTVYYLNGQIRSITEGATVYSYEYDESGNRTRETAQTSDSRGKSFHVSTVITFDGHNRIERITQDDVLTTKRVFLVTYDYDAAGNRTHVLARSGYGTNTIPISQDNLAPQVIGQPANRTVRSGVAQEFRVRLSNIFRDPEGQVLSTAVRLVTNGVEGNLPAWLSVSLDAGTGELVFTTTAGSSAANNQTFTLRLKATDSSSTAAENVDFQLSVRDNTTPADAAGAAISFPVRIGHDWYRELNVLDYFADPDVGDSLTISIASISPAAPWLQIDSSDPTQLRLSGNPAAGHAGSYTVTLRATDQFGASKTRTITLTVSNNAGPQVVAAPVDREVGAGKSFLIDLRLSDVFTDPESDALTVTALLTTGLALPPWVSFQYLSYENPPIIRLQGTVPWGTEGQSVPIRLTATDTFGASVNTSFNLLQVANVRPVLRQPIAQQSVGRNASFAFQLPADTFVDAEGQALTYSVTNLPAGLSYNASTRTISGTMATIGSYTITVNVVDAGGATASTTFVLKVVNVPPRVGTPISTLTYARNTAISFTFLPTVFIDDNGDTLTYSATGMPPGVTFNAGTRTFSGTPTTSGSYIITLVATDPSAATVSTTFVMTIGNVAPTVQTTIPNQSVQRNQAYSYTVPSNTFADVNSDTLTYSASGLPAGLTFNASTRVISGTPTTQGAATITITVNDGNGGTVSTSFTLSINNSGPTLVTPIPAQTLGRNAALNFQFAGNTFGDANNDSLTYTATGMPAGISFNGATRTFTGSTTVLGAHTITVTANDGNGGTLAATFTLTVTNSPPVANVAIPPQTSVVSTGWSYTVPAGTFSDPNGDVLTYRATQMEWIRVYDPETGVSIPDWYETDLPSWVSFNPATRTFTGTPPSTGTFRLKVFVSDGYYEIGEEFVLTITAAPNYPPVLATAIPNQTANANGTLWQYVIPAGTFTDPNGDTITYSVSGLPSWMGYNAATRTLSGTAGAQGSTTITVTATDSKGAASSTTFVVTVPNAAPYVASPIPDMSTGVNAAWSYTVPAGTFADRNGQTLTYSISGLPAGLSFNASTRVISGTPTTVGTYTVNVTASDGSLTVTDSFVLNINAAATNQPPVVNIPLEDWWGSNTVNYTFPANSFVDPNGDTLTYTATGLPATITFNASTRTFSGTVVIGKYSKVFTVVVTASDGRGGTVTDTFDINIPGRDEPLMAGGETQGFELMAQQLDPEDPGNGGGGGGSNPTTERKEESWYAYDKLNRVLVVNGTVDQYGRVVIAQNEKSYGVTYDAAGNESARYNWEYDGTTPVAVFTHYRQFSLRGELTAEYGQRIGMPGGTSTETSTTIERRIYDEAGRLTQIRSYYPMGTMVRIGKPSEPVDFVHIGGTLRATETTVYDNDGRVVSVDVKRRVGAVILPGEVDTGTNGETPPANPEDESELTAYSTTSYKASEGLGYDAAGRLIGYSYSRHAGYNGYTDTFLYQYDGWERFQEKQVSGTSNHGERRPTTTYITYDTAGRQKEMRENTPNTSINDRLRVFAYDGSGMIISRRDGTLTSGNFTQSNIAQNSFHFVYATGQQIGSLKEDGFLDVLSQVTAFSNTDSGRTTTMVLDGDTLYAISQRVYGNASLWYVIAEANGLDASSTLVEGTTLTIPEVKTSANDASTFKPYDASEVTGPSAPGLPVITVLPAKQKCKELSILIQIVVTIVVTVVTDGNAAAGAAAGAVAGQASQAMLNGQFDWGRWARLTANPFSGDRSGLGRSFAGLGMPSVTGFGPNAGAEMFWLKNGSGNDFDRSIWNPIENGMPETFDRTAVVISAAAGAASAGVGGAVSGVWGAVLGAAAAYGTSYQLNRIYGRDPSFSWRELVAVGASAAAAYGTAYGFGMTQEQIGTSRAYVKSGDFDWRSVALDAIRVASDYDIRKNLGMDVSWNTAEALADVFGNALGNGIVNFDSKKGEDDLRKKLEGSRTKQETYDYLVANDASKQDAYNVIMAQDQRLFSVADAFGAMASGEGFDDLSVDGIHALSLERKSRLAEIANEAFWSVYRNDGTVSVASVQDLSSDGSTLNVPNELPSSFKKLGEEGGYQLRAGAAASNVMHQGQLSLDATVEKLGARNVEIGFVALSFALGGPLKATASLAFDSVAGDWVAQLKGKYLEQPISDLAAYYAYGARTQKEHELVRPVSDATAAVGTNLILSAIGIVGARSAAKSIIPRVQGYRDRIRVQKEQLAARRELEISRRQDVDSEAGHNRRIDDAGRATSAFTNSQLKEHLRQIENYGKGGVRELQSGRIRYYGELKPAKNVGEMAGARLVREWDPATGVKRSWYETIDHSGTTRSIAPKPPTAAKNHRIFDSNGNYIENR